MENLNSSQKMAVEITDGPLLILAGAGTGKTKTLVARIYNIIKNNLAYPDQILAVTFTNKAANEMGERLGISKLPWLGTFHGLALKILRIMPEKVGLRNNFTILDADDQLKLLKSVSKDLNYELDQQLLKKTLYIIHHWKDKMILPSEALSTFNSFTNNLYKNAAKCYEAYQERLKSTNCVDFGDLLFYNMIIFNKEKGILEKYQNKFKYILVDEYQDTNSIQYLWLKALTGHYHNICCVGDDDQSIYGWRGAEVDNILRFTDDFPEAQVIRLECNYRSTPNILAAASSIIANNSNRFSKTLWTHQKEGEKIKVIKFLSSKDEANYIISYIRQKKFSLKNTAILVRASFQTRAFEEFCIAYSLSYKIVGGMKFYERREIKDIIAYLRILVNPDDDLAFERALSTPKRGIGESTLRQIYSKAVVEDISLLKAALLMEKNNEIKNKKLPLFLDFLKENKEQLEVLDPIQFLSNIIKKSGYEDMLVKEKDSNRIENINELLNVVSDFPTILDFLQYIGLVTDNERGKDEEALNIMTLHSSKGLEFDQVFLPGWEEGLFPHQRAILERNGLEEERRLAYVGITRAKKFLCITCARSRLVNNLWQYAEESRFLNELPSQNIEIYSGNSRLLYQDR